MAWLAPLKSSTSGHRAELWAARDRAGRGDARPALWPALGHAAAEEARPDTSLSFSEAELAAACAAAARQAVGNAERSWHQQLESRRRAAVAAIAETVGAAIERSAAARGAITEQAVELAWAMARRIAGAALSRAGEAEVAAMLRELVPDLDGVRELRIAVAPPLVEPVRAELAGMAADFGAAALVLDVEGDPALPVGDARVAWSDGWAERCGAMIEGELADRLRAWSATRVEPGEMVP